MIETLDDTYEFISTEEDGEKENIRVNKYKCKKQKKTANIVVFPCKMNNFKSSSGLNGKNVDDLIR